MNYEPKPTINSYLSPTIQTFESELNDIDESRLITKIHRNFIKFYCSYKKKKRAFRLNEK